MIKSKDRSGWIGASDTAMVMGNWQTETFRRWWLVKLGVREDNYTTLAMMTGTHYEHRILEHIGVRRMDRQIKIRRLRLRVNLDGETDIIHEVKTYGGPKFKVTKPYWMQAQVEMFAAQKPLEIVAYHLEPEDYRNWMRGVEDGRLSRHPVEYDQEWIKMQYLPRLRVLVKYLKRGAWPSENPN